MRHLDFTDLSSLLDLLLDVMCVVDTEGRFVFVSAGCERVFGYSSDELVGKAMIDFVHPADRERTARAASEIMSGEPKPIFENRYIHKSGATVYIMWSARWSEQDGLRIALARDITVLKRAEAMRAALHEISESVHAASDMPMLFREIHRTIGTLLNADNFFVALYDSDADRLSFPYHVDQHDAPPPPCPLAGATLTAEVIRRSEALLLTPATRCALPPYLHVPAGTDCVGWLGVPLVSHNGVMGVLAVQSYSDSVSYSEADMELLQSVSTHVAAAIERKQIHARLEFNAQYDHLTELPNRQLFNDRLQTALARAQRSGSCLALLYLDLDHFKTINDTFGHAIGDRILQEIGERLRDSVRESDTICRFGGDEFVVLLENIAMPVHASTAAVKILARLGAPLVLDNHAFNIQPSIGIAIYPEHGRDGRALLSQADKAMYAAKRLGGNRVEIISTAATLCG